MEDRSFIPLSRVYLGDSPIDVGVVQSLAYEETLHGVSSFNLHAISPYWKVWNDIVTASEPVDLRLQWGYLNGGKEYWSRIKHVVFSQMRMRYTVDAVDVIVEGVDRSFALGEVAHARTFKDMRISDMVAELAQLNGVTDTDIASTSGRYTFYQGTEPDGQFIRRQLLPRAIGQDGRTDYNFYFRDGATLVFRSPALYALKDARELIFDRTKFALSNVASFDVDFRRYYRGRELSYSLEMRGFDPLTKEALTEVADDDSVQLRPRLASVSPVAPGVPARIALSEADTPKKLRQEARTRWSEQARKLFQATVTVPPDVSVNVGTPAVLTIAGGEHFAAGKWLISGQKWVQLQNRLDLTLQLERRTHGR